MKRHLVLLLLVGTGSLLGCTGGDDAATVEATGLQGLPVTDGQEQGVSLAEEGFYEDGDQLFEDADLVVAGTVGESLGVCPRESDDFSVVEFTVDQTYGASLPKRAALLWPVDPSLHNQNNPDALAYTSQPAAGQELVVAIYEVDPDPVPLYANSPQVIIEEPVDNDDRRGVQTEVVAPQPCDWNDRDDSSIRTYMSIAGSQGIFVVDGDNAQPQTQFPRRFGTVERDDDGFDMSVVAQEAQAANTTE